MFVFKFIDGSCEKRVNFKACALVTLQIWYVWCGKLGVRLHSNAKPIHKTTMENRVLFVFGYDVMFDRELNLQMISNPNGYIYLLLTISEIFKLSSRVELFYVILSECERKPQERPKPRRCDCDACSPKTAELARPEAKGNYVGVCDDE